MASLGSLLPTFASASRLDLGDCAAESMRDLLETIRIEVLGSN